jgi:hypothetical protein
MNTEKETAMKKGTACLTAAIAIAVVMTFTVSGTALARGKGNPLPQPVVYVTSQGLYYDSTVTTDLPPQGRFQELEPTAGPHGGPQTEYGPGDLGFVGGRWWVDANGNREMDSGDVYFSCPLLGPGRSTP